MILDIKLTSTFYLTTNAVWLAINLEILFASEYLGVTSPAGYLQAAGYYALPTTAAQLQQSAALYAAQPSVSQQQATATGAGPDGRLQ